MQNISQILIIIMKIEGLKKDNDLAKLFGVGASTISTWKKRGTIPYKKLFTLCENKGWNYQEILTGEDKPFPDGVREPVVEYEKGDDPFARSVSGLRQIFDSQDQALIAAIQINIQAFQLSIHKDRQINQQSKEIQELKEECEELKTRVDALEKRAVGNAGAGSGSHAHTGDATRKKET